MNKKTYYYAGKQKIRLNPSEEWVAIDLARAPDIASAAAQRAITIQHAGPVSGTVHLISRSAVPHEVYRELDQQSAVLPVYRHGNALIVVLPEVRVEASGTNLLKIRNWLAAKSGQASIVEERGETLVLRPVSGRGVDALELANSLHEACRPKMAQARFLRVVPKPDSTPKIGS